MLDTLTRKRPIPKAKQWRNVVYLGFIAIMLLFAWVVNDAPGWASFLATAVYFWPQGHYGQWGVK